MSEEVAVMLEPGSNTPLPDPLKNLNATTPIPSDQELTTPGQNASYGEMRRRAWERAQQASRMATQALIGGGGGLSASLERLNQAHLVRVQTRGSIVFENSEGLKNPGSDDFGAIDNLRPPSDHGRLGVVQAQEWEPGLNTPDAAWANWWFKPTQAQPAGAVAPALDYVSEAHLDVDIEKPGSTGLVVVAAGADVKRPPRTGGRWNEPIDSRAASGGDTAGVDYEMNVPRGTSDEQNSPSVAGAAKGRGRSVEVRGWVVLTASQKGWERVLVEVDLAIIARIAAYGLRTTAGWGSAQAVVLGARVPNIPMSAAVGMQVAVARKRFFLPVKASKLLILRLGVPYQTFRASIEPNTMRNKIPPPPAKRPPTPIGAAYAFVGIRAKQTAQFR